LEKKTKTSNIINTIQNLAFNSMIVASFLGCTLFQSHFQKARIESTPHPIPPPTGASGLGSGGPGGRRGSSGGGPPKPSHCLGGLRPVERKRPDRCSDLP